MRQGKDMDYQGMKSTTDRKTYPHKKAVKSAGLCEIIIFTLAGFIMIAAIILSFVAFFGDVCIKEMGLNGTWVWSIEISEDDWDEGIRGRYENLDGTRIPLSDVFYCAIEFEDNRFTATRTVVTTRVANQDTLTLLTPGQEWVVDDGDRFYNVIGAIRYPED